MAKKKKKAPWWYRWFFGSPTRTITTGTILVAVYFTNAWVPLIAIGIVLFGFAMIFGYRP